MASSMNPHVLTMTKSAPSKRLGRLVAFRTQLSQDQLESVRVFGTTKTCKTDHGSLGCRAIASLIIHFVRNRAIRPTCKMH